MDSVCSADMRGPHGATIATRVCARVELWRECHRTIRGDADRLLQLFHGPCCFISVCNLFWSDMTYQLQSPALLPSTHRSDIEQWARLLYCPNRPVPQYRLGASHFLSTAPLQPASCHSASIDQTIGVSSVFSTQMYHKHLCCHHYGVHQIVVIVQRQPAKQCT